VRGAPWVALLLAACPEPKPAPSGLRVPLPEGWVATAAGTGLTVGPRGRVVVTLERRSGEVPLASELRDAVKDEGATEVLLDEGEGYAAVRYRLGPTRDGFLAARRVGPRTVFCASTARASPTDVDDGLALCRQVGLDE
jgi:hypothetical protein